MLVQLLYASRAASTVTAEMTESILQQSRAKNPEMGITGVLCQGGDVFMQLLEGGRAPVNALYNTIVRDARHECVMLLHYREVSERRFAGWTMGHVRLDLDLPGLRVDVDDARSLAEATRLGLGPHSARALARATVHGVQATIHRIADDGSGSALLDDGVEVDLPPDAAQRSGLRHLRVGQRVSIERDESGAAATRVWITGIGPGEDIH